MALPHITVCICTYQRPGLLRRLLVDLGRQDTQGMFTFSAVVCDNDAAGSARPIVAEVAAQSRVKIVYCSETRKNIALARNRAVAASTGDFVAFIDDDEFPVPEWLVQLYALCESRGVAGVLGPVRPHFDTPPPRWLIAGKFCERPEHSTGTAMPWKESRTGNVLLRRRLFTEPDGPFLAEFGTGGEDVDFFRRMALRGEVFLWCNEAVAYETVPPSRWTRSYMLKRALLRGRNNLKIRNARAQALLKSFLAVPAYSLVLPGALLLGQHVFMKYGIKFCDHLGRVLALFGINPVKERTM
jgi:succinoglycan biosynthesis protein ExoM